MFGIRTWNSVCEAVETDMKKVIRCDCHEEFLWQNEEKSRFRFNSLEFLCLFLPSAIAAQRVDRCWYNAM